MRDDRRRGRDSERGEYRAPDISQVYNLMCPYKILIPEEKYYSNAFPIIIFSQENALKYDEIVNAYIMSSADSVSGNAVIWFTDIRANIFASTIAEEDFNVLKDDRIKVIGIGDVGMFRTEAGEYGVTEKVKNIVVKNLYIRSKI